MINYTMTPTATVGHSRVYDTKSGRGFTLEAVQEAPDYAALLDTLEDELLENIKGGGQVNIKDLAQALVAKAKKELLGTLLIRLLILISDSDNVKLDIEILISAAGLPLRDEPDSAIAARFGIMRQTFSARKKTLLKKLGLTPPPHSKSLTACETYKQSNRRNGTIEEPSLEGRN